MRSVTRVQGWQIKGREIDSASRDRSSASKEKNGWGWSGVYVCV